MSLTSNQNDAFWDRADAVLQRYAPRLFASFNPPATAEQIAEAEQQLGMTLPQEVRDAYFRHNGSPRDGPALFINWGNWCSLEEMVGYWKRRVSTLEQDQARSPDIFPEYAPYWDTLKVSPVWWNRFWIPIGRTNTISTFYIDMQPGPLGVVGQVIEDFGMCDAAWKASSFNAYLTHLIDHLETRRLVYDAPARNGYTDTRTGKEAWWFFWLKTDPIAT
jgi:cell wall assembly regulator SMI1